MIRLITSDLDGTLLLDGAWELSEDIFPLIRRVTESGVAFAVASGRQHYRLRRMFESVAQDIYFICENGAVVYKGDRQLSETRLDPALARELIGEIVAHPECDVLISGAKSCYLMPKTEEYVHLIRDLIGYRTEIVSSVDEIPEEIIKVSAYRRDGAAVLQPQFCPKWDKVFRSAIAGHEWLDFTLSDKGTGLDVICADMGITPAEVMSFGDNYNDAPLMDKVGYPYIMDNACDALKERYAYHTASVPKTLENFLAERCEIT